MGVTKTIITEGTGAIPVAGQNVIIEYTGWLKDTSKSDQKGNKYVLPLLRCLGASDVFVIPGLTPLLAGVILRPRLEREGSSKVESSIMLYAAVCRSQDPVNTLQAGTRGS